MMNTRSAWLIFATLLISACSTAPKHGGGSGGYLAGDGPGNADTTRLASVPDAVPRAEALHKYANRPYEALGVRYVPITTIGSYKERGIASWYGKKFHGQRTSSGETYDMYAMSAAHKTLPIPSYARVTNISNGRSVIVRINDRGPFMHGRIIDLSYAAAAKLGYTNSGSTEVEVESLKPGDQYVASAAVAEPVKVEPIQTESIAPEPTPIPEPATPAAQAGTVFLQLGSFRSASGAESFLAHMRDELGDLGKQVLLYNKGGLARVHLGPYHTRDEARNAADQLAPRLGFKPFVSLH